MDDGLRQDLPAVNVKKEMAKLHETVASSAANDSVATSYDQFGAGDFGAILAQHEHADLYQATGKSDVEVCKRGLWSIYAAFL